MIKKYYVKSYEKEWGEVWLDIIDIETKKFFSTYFYEYAKNPYYEEIFTDNFELVSENIQIIFEGELYFDFVNKIKEVPEQSFYFSQNLKSEILAVVVVTRKINNKIFYVKSNINSEEMIVHIEIDFNCEVGKYYILEGLLHIYPKQYSNYMKLLDLFN